MHPKCGVQVGELLIFTYAPCGHSVRVDALPEPRQVPTWGLLCQSCTCELLGRAVAERDRAGEGARGGLGDVVAFNVGVHDALLDRVECRGAPGMAVQLGEAVACGGAEEGSNAASAVSEPNRKLKHRAGNDSGSDH